MEVLKKTNQQCLQKHHDDEHVCCRQHLLCARVQTSDSLQLPFTAVCSGKVNSANEAAEGVQACVKFSTDHFYDGIDRHVAGEREWMRTGTGLVTFCIEKVECFLWVSSGHNPTNTSQQVAGEYLAHNVSCRRPRMTLTRQDESPVVKEQHRIGRWRRKYSLVCRYASRQDPAHHNRGKCLEKINNSVCVRFLRNF